MRLLRLLDEIALRAQHFEISAGTRELGQWHDRQGSLIGRQRLAGRIDPQRVELRTDVGRDDLLREVGGQ